MVVVVDDDDDDDDDDDANDEDVRRRNNEAPSPALPCPLKPHASTSSDSWERMLVVFGTTFLILI